jgi:hypothetical protein
MSKQRWQIFSLQKLFIAALVSQIVVFSMGFIEEGDGYFCILLPLDTFIEGKLQFVRICSYFSYLVALLES